MATAAIAIGDIEQAAVFTEMLLMTTTARFASQDLGLRSACKVIRDFVARAVACAVVQANDVFVGPPQRIESNCLVGQMALIAAILVEMEVGLRKLAGANLFVP